MGRPREISPEERAELIRQGYRPIEIWVPDPTNEVYLREARRQSRLVAKADEQDDAMDWVEAVGPVDWDKP